VVPGHGQTHLVTDVFDQAQLHGLLNRVRDFGFDLVSVAAAPDDLVEDRPPLDGAEVTP